MSKAKPTKNQLEFLNWEMGVFFHFGIRTFYQNNVDWDEKPMDASVFNPEKLDCRQWIKTIKEAGAKYAVLTCKHHDGFANWPSKYTEYSVKNTPWKNGQGDVVREYVDACREFGIKVGLYYSPAQFGSRKMQGREYDDYFINQISELLTDYGKIDYLWFDGCGSENHEYDRKRIVEAIRSLQPEILIFSMWDPDTRWVGNEEGIAPFEIYNTISPDSEWQEAAWLDSDKFLPYECDCRIRRKSWFYKEADEKYLRDTDDMLALYEYSVGRGGNLLLNIGPNTDGLLPEKDSQNFIDFGRKLKERYQNPIECNVTEDNGNFRIEFEKEQNVNCVVLEEDLTDGESVTGFEFGFEIMQAAPVYFSVFSGKNIGHKRICTFPQLFGNQFVLKITAHNGDFKLKSIKCFCID